VSLWPSAISNGAPLQIEAQQKYRFSSELCRCFAELLCEHQFVDEMMIAYLSACRLGVAALYCKLRERKDAHEAQPGVKTKAATGDAAAHSANNAVDSNEGDITPSVQDALFLSRQRC
jgi:hypothetical protein